VSLDIPTDMDAHEAKPGRSAVTILWEVDADLRQMSAMRVRLPLGGYSRRTGDKDLSLPGFQLHEGLQDRLSNFQE